MIKDANELQVSLQQMGRLILSVDDMKQNVLPKNPKLFATMVEAPLEDLDRIRLEVEAYLGGLKSAG